MPDFLSTVYCTDEDIFVRAFGDFREIIPESNTLARGSDGVLSAGLPWVLNSSVDFESFGVTPGHIVQLSYDTDSSVFGPEGECFAVDSVVGTALTLRRPGKPPAIGFPPGSPSGLNNVTFLVTSFDPQIEDASWELNARYGIDDNIQTIQSANLYRVRELRQACVLTVLGRAYAMASRQPEDDYARKARQVIVERDDLFDRIVLHWKSGDDFGHPTPGSRFKTRMSR